MFFADDVVVWLHRPVTSSALKRFTAEFEASGLRKITSKSEAMVLSRKMVECLFRVGKSCEILPQVEEFKYLGVLFTTEGKMERKRQSSQFTSSREESDEVDRASS